MFISNKLAGSSFNANKTVKPLKIFYVCRNPISPRKEKKPHNPPLHSFFGFSILNSTASIKPSVVYAPPTMAHKLVR